MSTTFAEPIESIEPSIRSRRGADSAKLIRPGCYVCNRTGRLIRVDPEDPESVAGIPIGAKAELLTKLSGNPYVSLTQARVQAANLNIEVAF
jgi:hypothetical protein